MNGEISAKELQELFRASGEDYKRAFNEGIEAAAKLLDQEAYHSAYAAEMASSIRSLAK